jgi:metal-responsive CopG/Arc/MetJ family transcriptional regulator
LTTLLAWTIIAINIHIEVFGMKTVQMTLDEELVKEVDRVSAKLHTSRSAFTRMALAAALERYKLDQLEQQHRQGYAKHPVAAEEFSIWENEHDWGDE